MILRECIYKSLWGKCHCAVEGGDGEKLCDMDGHKTMMACPDRINFKGD